MIKIRKASERGFADHGWLKANHSFSFANYIDPAFMGFRSLRVMNEDHIAAGRGFGMHPHKDMEIVTIVLEGGLQHKDSMGNSAVLKPNDVQRMSAGTGLQHSEVNASSEEELHLYQIWLVPQSNGIEPGYEDKTFLPEGRRNKFQLLASPDGHEGSHVIHQDVLLYRCELSPGERVDFSLSQGSRNRALWVQSLKGEVEVNDIKMSTSDGLMAEEQSGFEIKNVSKLNADFILFDLA